ncbi:MAG TPA: alpha/beta fold hydrolase [Thermoanaerobaculia bacterium]|nr:alpha/beta fold hydrolase [Thermoanaerobaculia bacterium]
MNSLSIRRLVAVAVSILLASASVVAQESLTFNITLRENVTTQVTAQVYSNPSGGPGIDVFIVPGLAQTAATFEPLANALFDEHLGDKVARVIVADLPGHGNSAVPDGLVFGLLALEDYVTSTLGVIDALDTIDVVIGHSMGALIVQLAQERLAAQGTSLRAELGIRGAVLIAPVPAKPAPWAFVDSGTALGILSAFVRIDPVLGPVVDFPPSVWPGLFYLDRAGNPVGVPSPADLARYISLESASAGSQVVHPVLRPSVRLGLFGRSSGTVAGVISLEQDGFFQFPGEHATLYGNLTGDSRDKLFFPLIGPDTVHNMHTFNPQALLHPIKKVINSIDRR